MGGAEGIYPPPTLLVRDEETYRLLRDYWKLDPQRNSWIREQPGHWHVKLRRRRAMSNRCWGAGNEVVAEELAMEDKKSEYDAHYRRLHHRIIVTFEVIMNVFLDMFYAELDGTGSTI